ncbi:LAGLIDADG family homing endonuclease [Actinomadura barringtoniae]|nr:LAGLIDADG family homing endonuclease [Actinomadura barringtoniae]
MDGSIGFTAETRVITWEGARPIGDLADSTQRVLGRDAQWHTAFFDGSEPGTPLQVTVGRNRQVKELFAAPEQVWFVRESNTGGKKRELTTARLRRGHRLAVVFPGSRVQLTTPSPFGIAHGITFGDGTMNGTGSMATLDSVKDIGLLKWFPNSRVTRSIKERPQLLVHHLPAYFRRLPPLDESVSYLSGWLAGYLAADGHVSKDGTVMLNCAQRAVLEYVRVVCTRLGIGTYGITEQVREGFPGREPSSIFRVHFVNEDMTERFFLLDEHLVRFRAATKAYARRGWVVRSVTEGVRAERLFVPVMRKGGGLAIEDNILVGATGGPVLA